LNVKNLKALIQENLQEDPDLAEELRGKYTENSENSKNAPGSNSFHKTFAKPEKFNGQGDITKFLKQYDIAATINGWNNAKKLEYIPLYLKDMAFDFYYNSKFTNWENFKELITDRFTEIREIYEIKLSQRKKKEGESLNEYISDIQTLCQKIDPKMEQPEICKYIMKGLDINSVKSIAMHENNTINQIRKNLEKYEFCKFLEMKSEDQSNKLAPNKDDPPPKENNSESNLDEITDKILKKLNINNIQTNNQTPQQSQSCCSHSNCHAQNSYKNKQDMYYYPNRGQGRRYYPKNQYKPHYNQYQNQYQNQYPKTNLTRTLCRKTGHTYNQGWHNPKNA